MDEEIDVLREPSNEPEGLGQGGCAPKEQSRMPAWQPTIERLKDETDPEVLFNVTGRRIEPARRRFEHVPPVPVRKREKRLEGSIHSAAA